VKLPRRKFLHLAAGAAALPAMSRVGSALDYPTRPVHIVAAFPAGGTQDILMRLFAQWLSQRFSQPFVVENRTGAGGNVGTESVVRSAPDGYTLLGIGAYNTINATLYTKLNFDFVRDITPVAGIMRGPLVMATNPSFPATTVSEFIAYAKTNPDKVNFGSGGNGSPPHVAGELFKLMAGINMMHVPYRGEAPALNDLLAGWVQVVFANLPASIGFIRAGKFRPLAVTTSARADVLPNIPTVADFIPGYEATNWQGIGASKNVGAGIIGTLNREVNAGLADPVIKQRLAELGGVPMSMTPTEIGKLVLDETDKWGKVLKAADIKMD
jgi:tripartite-type tricarboxylate transporter receptor subunit TctC